MYILGIVGFAHDSAACLIKDGVVTFFIEEERINREKHTSKFPINAIKECLNHESITLDQVDHICFFEKSFRQIKGNIKHFLKYFPDTLNLLKNDSAGANSENILKRIFKNSSCDKILMDEFKPSNLPKVNYIEHHLSHAASTYYCSSFDEAAILSIDGRGEATTTLMGHGRGSKIDKIQETPVPHSMGHFYAAITDYLGFKAFHDEWKVMGLSAYGRNTYVKDFESILTYKGDGVFEIDLSYMQFHTHGQSNWLSSKFIEKFGPKRKPNSEITQHHMDISFALQRVIEKVGVELANDLYEKTKSKNLCLAGGVILNCLMNAKIIEQTKFENFFIQPIANDAGCALGCALYYYHHELDQPRTQSFPTVYLGNEYDNQAIEKELEAYNLNFKKCDDIACETAKHIAKSEVISWFQGRMEAGPRALGNRSIIANPCDPTMKDILNRKVKKREFFRPFAPSILEEEVEKYFIIPKKQLSPHMIITGDVIEDKRSLIPAVTHEDNTARVQTVNKNYNTRYWNLINEVGKLTGHPVVLNTSFNENEPIVRTPKDAIECFLRTEIDVLVLNDYLITKS